MLEALDVLAGNTKMSEKNQRASTQFSFILYAPAVHSSRLYYKKKKKKKNADTQLYPKADTDSLNSPLPPLNLNPNLHRGDDVAPKPHRLRSLRERLNFIILQQISQYHLELVRDKESPGTAQILLVSNRSSQLNAKPARMESTHHACRP